MGAAIALGGRSLFRNLDRTWPLDARMAMFVLEAGGQDPQFVRERHSPRQACRIIATVCGSDPRSLAHWIVYIRDMNDGHLGFISQTNLTVGRCSFCRRRQSSLSGEVELV